MPISSRPAPIYDDRTRTRRLSLTNTIFSVIMISPFSFEGWLAENQDKLCPPVNNYCLYDGDDFTLMVVGGPNERNDYHSMCLCFSWAVSKY
jgi:hypothetical protein